MSYQPCRWYDPYPRLAFALKLLHLSPQSLQRQALQELRSFLSHEWGESRTSELLNGIAPSRQGQQRWYDEDPQTAGVVELLRDSPSTLKTRVAEKLLTILCPLDS